MKAKWKDMPENELKELYETSKTFGDFCEKLGYNKRYDALSNQIKKQYEWYKGITHYKDLTNKKVGLLTIIEKNREKNLSW